MPKCLKIKRLSAMFFAFVLWSSTLLAQDADKFDRLVLGFDFVVMEDVTDTLARWGKTPTKKGIIVTEVSKDSPAEKAGLRPMNLINNIDGKPVANQEDVAAAIAAAKPGKPLTLKGYTLRENVWKPGKLLIKPLTYREYVNSSILVEKDKVDGKIFYRHNQSHRNGVLEGLSLQLIEVDGVRVPHVMFAYFGSEWVFADKILVTCDGKKWERTFDQNEIVRDVIPGVGVPGGVKEWIDLPCDADLMNLLNDIAKSKEVFVRFIGKTRQADEVVNKQDISRIRLLLDMREILGDK